MKKLVISIFCSLLIAGACSKPADANNGGNGSKDEPKDVVSRNITRAVDMVDTAMKNYFPGTGSAMVRYYNPYTNLASAETGSVWMYTASIEAVNAIMRALDVQKQSGDSKLYDLHYARMKEYMATLYKNAGFYQGTFTLVSYTQTKEWTVYGVNRGAGIGGANVEGVENVYDDQMWLVRELYEAYELTGVEEYLTQAEYLTEYVLDGWDTTLNSNGKENGGIPWGPGYVTKHSCSNGPMVSPLVWLAEHYKGTGDQITRRYIDAQNKRQTKQMNKYDYYLEYAKAVYEYQKSHLMGPNGVYDDMMGGIASGGGKPEYETIDGVKYRKHTALRDRVGPAISYNSGTMLSGAADLYRATGENVYLEDMKALSDNSFAYFAKLGTNVEGHYTYDISGFRNWFNGVLMRGFVDVYPAHTKNATAIESFQKNLDYAHSKFLYKGMLPTNLLVGWNRDGGKNNTEGMFTFTFAAEYAVLARYELEKLK